MKAVLDFKMETRPYGDGYTNMVGIVCGWCRTEAWHPAKNGGWAVRIFRATGWKVGSKRTQDRCPTCFGKARNARRTPDNPVLTKEQATQIKARMDAQPMPTKSDLLHTSVFVPKPITVWEPVEQPTHLTDPIPPAEPQPPPAAIPEAPAGVLVGRRGQRVLPGQIATRRRVNAVRAAKRVTCGEDGVDFYTVPHGDMWLWKLPADTTPEERAAWTPSRVYPPRQPKEEPLMTDKVVPITRQEPMPAEAPKLTREDRGLIHDELTKVYDIAAERYAGSDSDKVVAERLNVPRLGVSEVREMFFGAHDRNQDAVKKIASLDVAIEKARKASARLMEMAAEAETLERDLRAARKQLED